MKLEDSPLLKNCFIKFSEPFGDFFIFENFVVGEMVEGTHFDWEKAEILLKRIYDYFGTRDVDLSYISNRVNSYSVTAQDWLKFYQERHTVNKVAVVSYNSKGFMSVQLEKLFSKSTYKKFNSLEEAVQWVDT